ncbi:MAG: NADH-quinone oxidoreductase subunit L, partial [Chloroflexus sp.]|nr:NADH-quinone oxidoreductase subunit L [Chloroflexus sp.]
MAFFLQNAWLIPFWPLLASALITLTPVRRMAMVSAWLATGLMMIATVMALGLLAAVANGWALHDGQLVQLAVHH